MDFTSDDRLRRLFYKTGLAAALVFLLVSPHLRADPAPTLDSLKILDQGSELVLTWHFYYNQFPDSFVLREKSPRTLSMIDPATLSQNVDDIVSVAFNLRLDGQPIQPVKPPEVTIAPNKGCFATMIYPGRPRAHLEVRMPALQYMPPICVTSYQVFSVKDMGSGVSGDTLGLDKSVPLVIHYVQVASDGRAPSGSGMESPAWKAFKSAFRIPWINTNWLFICLLLLLTQGPKRVIPLVLTMVACWVLVCCLGVAWPGKFSFRMTETVLALPTVLVCVIAVKYSKSWTGFAVVILAAAVLNATHDVQQIPMARAGHAAPSVLALCLGFSGGMAMALILLVPIVGECRKYPEFQNGWAPRICGALAGMAVLLPLLKLAFGYR